MQGSDLLDKFMQSLRSALPATWKSTSWLLKLMIPISLTVALLQHWGVLAWIAGYLNPLFSMLGLPGESAVLFISGAAAGTYAGVAAMMSIHLTLRQATIVGIMILLCHALPMECTVNHKTGSNFWRMALIRIIMAFVAALCLNQVLPEMSQPYLYIGAAAESSLTEVLLTWAVSQTKIAVMVFLIIYSLMVLQCLIEAYSLLGPLSRMLSPLMRFFGLPRNAAYMWLVGNVLGLSYGSAVVLEMEEKGYITRQDANTVNYHLIMNHSMLEDTIVLAITGVSALWILGTRMFFALMVVLGRKVVKSPLRLPLWRRGLVDKN